MGRTRCRVDESISNETWLIKIADKKTCANLQTSLDLTVVLPSKCDGNNWQRMNRQVLPVKQFHFENVNRSSNRCRKNISCEIQPFRSGCRCYCSCLTFRVCRPAPNNLPTKNKMFKTLRLGLNRQRQLLPTRPRHSCPDNSSFRKARQSNSG